MDCEGVTRFVPLVTPPDFLEHRGQGGGGGQLGADGRERERPRVLSVCTAADSHLPSPVQVPLQPGSLVTPSRTRTCDKNLAVTGLPASGAQTEMALSREDSGSQTSGGNSALLAARLPGWRGT